MFLSILLALEKNTSFHGKYSPGNRNVFILICFLQKVFCFKPERNKRAQRALGRSPEEKVKGHSVANNREPQGHNLNNFGRGTFDDVIY